METGTLSNANFQIGAGSSLFTFDKFGNLGIAGTYQGATFDYQYKNAITNFLVTNNDANTDLASVSLASDSYVDAGTTLTSADVKGIVKNGDTNAAGLGFSGYGTATVPFEMLRNIYNTGSLTIAGNGCDPTNNPGCNTATGSVPTFINNVSAGYPTTTSTFGSAPYTFLESMSGPGTFSFGTTDTLSYSVVNNGSAGSINLTVAYNSSYSATAQVVYSYLRPDPPPSETPEPASFALFGGALFGIGILRKRATR